MFLPISIIVALLIVGATLLLRFKKQLPGILQQRQQQQNALTTMGQNKTSIIKQAANVVSKQVHFADIPTSNSRRANKSADAHLGNKNGHTKNKLRKTNGAFNLELDNNNNNNDISNNGEDTVKGHATADLLLDETDAPILAHVATKPVSSRVNVTKKQQQQQQQQRHHHHQGRGGRKRHNSESSKQDCSSDELFKVIAVSCLSKEEVEIAVESLLNKVESGEAQWRPPKSDPLLKLRNQLRDNEAALATEKQNHEQTRARLIELKTELQKERSESRAKIVELDSERVALQQALSLRQLNETSMKQTLCEMEKELRELHDQLGNRLAINDERYRKEIDHFERELSDAGEREQKLAIKMKQLREGLSELFPDLKADVVHASSDDWVHCYLVALKQLTTTVDQLRLSNNNNNGGHPGGLRPVVDKSTLTLNTSGESSRVGSPFSNGRSSRASSNQDYEKKLMETRLVELRDLIETLDSSNEPEGDTTENISLQQRHQNEQQIRDLAILKTRLQEAQAEFGLDSFRAEQERAKQLEEELCRYRLSQHQLEFV